MGSCCTEIYGGVYYMAAMTSDYHQPSDSVEKVSGDLIAKISRMGYLTVFAFANK